MSHEKEITLTDIPPAPGSSPPTPRAGNTWHLIVPGGIVIVFLVLLISAGLFAATAPQGSLHPDWKISVTADQPDTNTIIVRYHGGRDAASLLGLVVWVTDSRGGSRMQEIGSENATTAVQPGETISFTGEFSGKDRVQAAGIFRDKTEVMVIDTVL
jgi:hypothetical protein